MFVVDGLQSVTSSKQPKYYGKSYFRALLGLIVICGVSAAFAYGIYRVAGGPLVRVKSITDKCRNLNGVTKYESCYCETEDLQVRQLFSNRGNEMVLTISTAYLPGSIIARYPMQRSTTENFMGFFGKEFETWDDCIFTPTFLSGNGSVSSTPVCEQPIWLDDWEDSYSTCDQQLKAWNNQGINMSNIWAGHDTYLDSCVLGYEKQNGLILGEASVFAFLKAVEQDWIVSSSSNLPDEIIIQWLNNDVIGSASSIIHRSIMHSLSESTNIPVVVQDSNFLRDKIEVRNVCDSCSTFTCTELEEISGWDITLLALAYAGGFCSIFVLIATFVYELLRRLCNRIPNSEMDYAIDNIAEKNNLTKWSFWGKKNKSRNT